MSGVPEHVRKAARRELARRYFYDYCQMMYGNFYTEDREYLKTLCDTLQSFIEQNEKRILVINIPPRHGKSFTAKNFTEWLFGANPTLKVMTGSYNETLSTTFARQVRNTIEEKSTGGRTVFNDIFPDTRIKYGEASANIWSLDGSNQKNYLATSPTGTATGFGANIILVDDIIKNSEEAYNELVLEKHWDWFVNTMMQRTEGHDWKLIIIMTRWATNDLAGRVLDSYDDVEHVSYKAIQDDGTMLCNAILNANDYSIKTKNMALEIVEANYNQKPIDIEGRLYQSFMEYDDLPTTEAKKWNYTDTADKGTDFLCSVDYIEHNGDVYVTDVVMTDKPMEVTEPMVAEMLFTDGVNEAIIESNNGGRGFARNVERELMDRYKSNKCVITQLPQTSNKEARILASSAWVSRHVYMPKNWKQKYPEFYKQVMGYQKKGKNKHDDGVDVLAGIYERVANTIEVEYGSPVFL
jgi:predicted phage terminase large subunit-like protein